jgi:hypothetical protein
MHEIKELHPGRQRLDWILIVKHLTELVSRSNAKDGLRLVILAVDDKQPVSRSTIDGNDAHTNPIQISVRLCL